MNRFGNYMFSLLFAPLKRVCGTANQLHILCSVLGRRCDLLKQMVFRVREEASIPTCSEAMLPIHGADRNMPRLVGETAENYRIRLAMKGIIAAQAGTCAGIRNLARAFGYDDVEILKNPDPDRWAEATVTFIGGRIVVDDRDVLLEELNRIKPARTLLHLSKVQQYPAAVYVAAALERSRQITMEQE